MAIIFTVNVLFFGTEKLDKTVKTEIILLTNLSTCKAKKIKIVEFASNLDPDEAAHY